MATTTQRRRCAECGQMRPSSQVHRVGNSYVCKGRHDGTDPALHGRSVETLDADESLEFRAVPMEIAPSRNGRELDGYAAVFHSRTRIPNRDGDFDEVLLPGFADRSLRERTPVLQYDHGKDPRVGTVPIGKWTEWRADGKGYRVRGYLFDNPLVEPVRQALADGALSGLSFRFKVAKGGDRWERRNGGPDLRSVSDADVHEAGPVVFPAYRDAKVSLRDVGGLTVVERHFDDADDVDAEERFDEDDPALAVHAYACTWTGITEQRGINGAMRRTRIDPHAFDAWMEEWRAEGRPPIPVLRDHDRRQVVGHLVAVGADEVGLRVKVQMHNTEDGLRALADIHSGVIKGFSEHLNVVDDFDGGDLVEVRRANLVECGPTERPFDRGAVVYWASGREIETRAEFEGLDDLAEYVRLQTGVDTMARMEAEEREHIANVTEKVALTAELAREIARLQPEVADGYAEWARYKRPELFRQAQTADRDLKALSDELRDVLLCDRGLIANVLASAGADPGFRSPFRSVGAALEYHGLGRR